MQRRQFLTRGTLGALSLPALAPVVVQAAQHSAAHMAPSGPLASATMSFGAWRTDLDPPVDRHSNPQTGPAINWHPVTPHEVIIAAGGTVTFNVAGLHQIAIYDDGVQPSDIDASLAAADAPNLIDDPNHRIYRGLNPVPLRTPVAVGTPPAIQHVVSRDRIEVVHLARAGRFLVICTVRAHFVNDQMWGWINVLRAEAASIPPGS